MMKREDVAAFIGCVGFFGFWLYAVVQAFRYGGLEIGIAVLLAALFAIALILKTEEEKP